jgi:D-alanyl-D-alanine carboxypeptidase
MKKISEILTVAVILTLTFTGCNDNVVEPTQTCSGSPYNINVSHPKAAKFEAVMKEYCKKGMPGVSLLIEDENGIWTGSAGKADIEKNIAMQPCHIGKTASLTKIFMGSLSFKLAEEGYYSLDDKISKYIDKDIIKRIKYADQVTIRQLMAHQTGFYDHITDGGFYLEVLNNPGKNWEPEELIKYVYDKEAEFKPGESAGYSNSNTLLLSMVINKATGRHHSTLLREKILNPLNLTNTYYHRHEALPEGRITQGYFDLYNNGTIINVSNLHTGNGNGYNGIYSNVSDLYTFINALFVKKSIISDSSLSQMLVFHPEEEAKKYLGVGSFKDFIHRKPDEYAIGHRGRDLAYSADLFYFPEKKRTLSMLVNYGNDANSRLKPVFEEFRDKIVDVLME